MKRLLSILSFILSHPLARRNKKEALSRFFCYQLGKLFNPYPIVYSLTDKSKLIIEKEMTGATGNIYCGLHEFEDMAFLLHFLRNEDLFVDIGANVGSYTVLASGHIGCKTISIEPIPRTFERLKNNIAANHMADRVECFNIGLGSSVGRLWFTSGLDTVNHVVTGPEHISDIEIKVETLDTILFNSSPILIKIDVEGFEFDVLSGASTVLSNPNLRGLIIELNNSGMRYGHTDDEVHALVLSYGFNPHSYNPFLRELSRTNKFGTHNTIYLREPDFVISRIGSAESFEMFGISI